jgi:5'-AMP-activated protein kinase, catalytic alpha subunit
VHLPTNRKVAIKILHKKMIIDARDKSNVSREMQLIKKLRHPNVIQLLQVLENNAKIFFVMEHVSGGELF